MTCAFTLLNDVTNQPAVYSDRSDLDAFTLTITTDSAVPIAVPLLRIGLPLHIFTLAQIAKITVISPGWNAPTLVGPFIMLTPTASLSLIKDVPLMLKLTGVSSTNSVATTDVVQLFVGSEAPTAKIFLMRYPAEAGDLTTSIGVEFRPATVYRTPLGFDRVENVLTLRLSNLMNGTPLVRQAWVSTPTVTLSFVYGNDIGSLTPADLPISNPHSAYNIQVGVIATYKDGKRSYEWKATQPAAPGVAPSDGPSSPVWTLQPVAENLAVLGAGAGATVEFRISGLSSAAPAGTTLAYLQFTDFPAYNDCFFAIQLSKDEPHPAIVYFDGMPNYVEAPGGTVTLEWQTLQMARVALQADGKLLTGPFDIEHGTYSMAIERSTEFALMAFTSAGDTRPAHTAQWTAHAPDAQIINFSADHASAADGAPVTLSWSTRYALSGAITSDGAVYEIPQAILNGCSKTYYPRKPTQWSLHVTGQSDPPDRKLTVFVLPRGWAKRVMGFAPYAGEGPVLLGNSAGLTLLGGSSENAIFQTHDGVNWIQVGIANFPWRYDAAGCTLADKLWITGGLSGNAAASDVWCSTDGLSWTQTTAKASWPGRSEHGCVAFSGKLWVIGGRDQNRQPLNDVWSSSDGVTWTLAAPSGARWSPRSGPAVAAFGGKLWLFGGLQGDGSVACDMWNSSDGTTWNLVSSSDIPGGCGPEARHHACLASPDESTLYLFGGIDASGKALDDFCQLDGDSWDLVAGPGGWTVRRAGSAVWQGALWFAGGMAGSASTDQVWSWYQPPIPTPPKTF